MPNDQVQCRTGRVPVRADGAPQPTPRRPARRTCARPSLISRSTSTSSAARKRADAARPRPAHPGSRSPQREACTRSGSERARARPRRPPRRRCPRAGCRRGPRAAVGVDPRRRAPISTYSASRRDAGGRRADPADLRVRAEAGAVGHRHLGAAQRALEGAGDVAVAGEAQPAALGVAEAELLDRRGRRAGRSGGALAHVGPPTCTPDDRRAGAASCRSGPTWMSVPMLRADAAVEAGDPAAVVELALGERVLPVRPEPLLVEPGVEVVPGQHLVLARARGWCTSRRRRRPCSAAAHPAVEARSARSSRRSRRRRARPARCTAPTRRSPRASSPSTMPGLPSW